MKSLVVVLLVVASAASSLTAASDTLRVISYRVVDMCSSEQRWLIAAYMGPVYNSDSLQSFDITLGYDTSRITPTDGLISGTLADQMKFGDLSPYFRFVVPGEIRAGAFTVTRNVVGDLPLFAVAGTYKGECGDIDTLTLPWNPNSGFNEEFKGFITTFASDSIIAVAEPRDDPSQGPIVLQDSVQFSGRDSTDTATVRVDQQELTESEVVDLLWIQDDDLVVIDSVLNVDADSIKYSLKRDSVWVYRTVGETPTIEYDVIFRSTTESEDTVTRALISSSVLTDCGCVTPTRSDELILRSQHTTTSVDERDVHESTDLLIRHLSDALELQCSHGQPWNVMVVDLTGRRVASTRVEPGTISWLSLSPLPKGTYIVYAFNGKRTQGLTIAR